MCRPASIVEAGVQSYGLRLQSPNSESAPRLPGSADAQSLQAGRGPTEASDQIEELYRQHSPALVRHLARRTGCSELARELANEAFLRIIRLAPAKLRSIEQPQAYLWSICANLLRDWGRGQD